VPVRAATTSDREDRMTTATKPKTDVLAGLAEREEAWADAKAEASQLGSELGLKTRDGEGLVDQRRRLVHHEPGLVDHQGNPNPAVKDNPVAAVDEQLTALGDLVDLRARVEHARALEERAKQSAHDFTASHFDEILGELEPQAEALVGDIVGCMAALADASNAYLNMARRVDGLKGTDRQRQHQRVPAIDTGSDLVNLSHDFEPPPLPTVVR
jgi:hypothetical protein